jgi:hypothetical protein
MRSNAVDVLFIAGFGPVVRDAAPARKRISTILASCSRRKPGGYLHTEALQGAKTFALWPLSEAPQSCFGSSSWPRDIPVPQAWLEFEVNRGHAIEWCWIHP